jgi:hypothetical protein
MHVGDGAHVSGVVGQNAMGHAAIRMEPPDQAVGQLAAGLQALRYGQDELPAADRPAPSDHIYGNDCAGTR